MSDSKSANPLARIYSLVRTGPKAILLRFYDQITRIITGSPRRKLSEIVPGLWVGGQHSPRGWEAMQACGISAVVNMREARHDDAAKGIVPQRYLHLPTRDNTPVSLEDLRQGVAFIREEIASQGIVYIHCGVGVGRAPLMAAAYLIAEQGLSADDAIRKLRSVRPFVHPTPGQRRQLHHFAEALKSGELVL